MKQLRNIYCSICTLSSVVFYSGCSVSDDSAQEWLAKQAAPQSVKLFTPSAPFVPLNYAADQYLDPFSTAKIKSQLPQEEIISKEQSPFALEAVEEMKRQKGPLEKFSLDTVRFVGSIKNTKTNIALLNINNLVYQAHVGERIGMNFGKIIEIDDDIVKVRELVQSGDEWQERISELKLPVREGSN